MDEFETNPVPRSEVDVTEIRAEQLRQQKAYLDEYKSRLVSRHGLSAGRLNDLYRVYAHVQEHDPDYRLVDDETDRRLGLLE